MANLAFQVTGSAFQGQGQFAFQGSVDEAAPRPTGAWLTDEQVRALRSLARRARLSKAREWEERKDEEARRLVELRRVYDRALGIVDPEPEAAEALVEAIAPFVRDDRPSGTAPTADYVNWDALERSNLAVRSLAEALIRLARDRGDDEEAALMLLLM